MKRYIRASIFTDTVKSVSGIYYYDDIHDAKSQSVLASDSVSDEEDQEISDMNDLASSDSYLMTLDESHVQKIQNLELIGRIGRLNDSMYQMLTQDQKMQFATWARATERMTTSDVAAFLIMLKKCKNVRYAFYYKKNEKFAQLYGLSETDILEVLQSLTIDNYEENNISYDKRTWYDTYIVFHKNNVKLSSGKDLGNISIYMKLDVDLTDESTVVYVSFHEN